MKTKLIVIAGATASGKTELAIRLAQKFNGEIVSADSRQVYREINIGTAKPARSYELRVKSNEYLAQGIRHHLIDIVYPHQEFNVAIFKKRALVVIQRIQKRGKLPFLVGGTCLYLKAIVDNLELPAVAPQKELRKELGKKSRLELFQIYQKLDPAGAKLIEKDNPRRLVRAIEVVQATSQSFWQQRKKGQPLFSILQVGLKVPLAELEKRISQRTDQMIKDGLPTEVERLVKKYGWEAPGLQTIGYQEWKNQLSPLSDHAQITDAQIKAIKKEIARNTLQYAKYQSKWFGKDKRIHWITNYPDAEKLLRDFLANNRGQS